MKATIEIRFGDGRREARSIEQAVTRIGREEGDIVLGDPMVSGRHAELLLSATELRFRDVGSSNGSFAADGQRITELKLEVGQSVRMGNCEIVVTALPLAAPAGAPSSKKAFAGTIVMNPGLGAVPPPGAGAKAPAAPAPAAPAPSPYAAPAAPAPGAAPSPYAAPAAPAPGAPSPYAAPAPAPAAAPAPSPHAAPAAPAPAAPSPYDAPALPDATPLPPPMTPVPPPSASPPPAAAPSGQALAPAASDNIWETHDAGGATGDGFEGGFAGQGGVDAEGFAAAPLGVTPGRAGMGMSSFADQLKQRLLFTWQLLQPHLPPLAKFIGLWLGPFALAQVVLGFIPVLGLLAIPVSMIQGILSGFFVAGVVAQYAMRVHRGETPTIGECIRAHMGVLIPWAITMVIVGIVGFIGFWFFVIPAIMFTWAAVPSFVVEGKRYFEPVTRSFELFRGDWLHLLQAMAILIIAGIPVWFATTIVAMALTFLSPLFSVAVEAIALPFSMLYSIGLFLETRARRATADDL